MSVKAFQHLTKWSIKADWHVQRQGVPHGVVFLVPWSVHLHPRHLQVHFHLAPHSQLPLQPITRQKSFDERWLCPSPEDLQQANTVPATGVDY